MFYSAVNTLWRAAQLDAVATVAESWADTAIGLALYLSPLVRMWKQPPLYWRSTSIMAGGAWAFTVHGAYRPAVAHPHVSAPCFSTYTVDVVVVLLTNLLYRSASRSTPARSSFRPCRRLRFPCARSSTCSSTSTRSPTMTPTMTFPPLRSSPRVG